MSRDISEHGTRVYRALKNAAESAAKARMASSSIDALCLMRHQLIQLAMDAGISDPWKMADSDLRWALRSFAPERSSLDRLDWMTNADIANSANVAERTARKHTSRLVYLGIVEADPAYPAHVFRLNSEALTERGQQLLVALDRSLEASASRQRS